METWISELSSELFWDVSLEAIDPVVHERWLIERVIQRGRWEDWLLLSAHYDKSRLLKLSPLLRLDPKSKHFIELYCSL